MSQLLIVLILVLVSVPSFGASQSYLKDIDRDGIKEKVVWKEYEGGNNLWGKLIIYKKNKIVFSSRELCLAYEGYGFIDIDSRYPGEELILTNETTLPGYREGGRWVPGYRSGIVYHLDKAKNTFVAYCLIHKTSRKYPALDVRGPIQDFRRQWPKIKRAIQTTERFVSFVDKELWSRLPSLMSRDPSTDSLSGIKEETGLFRQIPPSQKWAIETSRHDPNNVVLTFPLRGNYGIFVVVPDGINKFALSGGREWD